MTTAAVSHCANKRVTLILENACDLREVCRWIHSFSFVLLTRFQLSVLLIPKRLKWFDNLKQITSCWVDKMEPSEEDMICLRTGMCQSTRKETIPSGQRAVASAGQVVIFWLLLSRLYSGERLPGGWAARRWTAIRWANVAAFVTVLAVV